MDMVILLNFFAKFICYEKRIKSRIVYIFASLCIVYFMQSLEL